MTKRIRFNPKSKGVQQQWQKAYEGIKSYRMNYTDPSLPRPERTEIQKYHSLTWLMLGSQTKWQLANAAHERLKEHGLTVENMRATSEEDLKELIKGVRFVNTKARHLKKSADMLAEKFDGVVPSTYKEVISLPGIGPQMTTLYLQINTGEIVGITVDSVVHRVATRLEWADAKTFEGTRATLEKFIPEPMWHRVYFDLLTFGEKVCYPVKPACYDCKISKYCPFPTKTKKPVDK